MAEESGISLNVATRIPRTAVIASSPLTRSFRGISAKVWTTPENFTSALAMPNMAATSIRMPTANTTTAPAPFTIVAEDLLRALLRTTITPVRKERATIALRRSGPEMDESFFKAVASKRIATETITIAPAKAIT